MKTQPSFFSKLTANLFSTIGISRKPTPPKSQGHAHDYDSNHSKPALPAPFFVPEVSPPPEPIKCYVPEVSSSYGNVMISRDAAQYIGADPKSMIRIARKNGIVLVLVIGRNGNFFRVSDLDLYLTKKAEKTATTRGRNNG